MPKYAEYIKKIEIDSLWSGKKHIVWDLDPKVNILSGINGVGKSTILNKVLKGLSSGGEFPSHMLKGVRIEVVPEDAKWIRYDSIRSFDRPLVSSDLMSKVVDASVTTELDWQLYQLQRKYLDYQVNIGNRIIEALQSGDADAAVRAQQLSEPKKKFPYQLSSGEKQILAILLTVLIEDNLPYVLFMDEPEISLHIEWQKNLIDMIMDLNPHVQIVLTTHSPAVIMNGWMDSVTEVSDITV